MKLSKAIVTSFFCLAPFAGAGADAAKGREYFEDVKAGNCKACHSTSDTKLVGPGMANLMARHSEEWVRMFITDPQKTWETDHPETIELKKRIRGGMAKRVTSCRKAPMSEETKRDLIDYFKSLGTAPAEGLPKGQ